MTGTDSVVLKQVIVHKVGNPTRGEELVLSDSPLEIEDEIDERLLVKYFLNGFNENEFYHFTHLDELALNEVYAWVTRLFDEPAAFVETSAHIASFLHSKSTHVKVKEGEVYIAMLENVPFENEYINAIGIFKSETRETFLQLLSRDRQWKLTHQDGINIDKADKGCLVYRTSRDEGYKVCVLDNTNKQQDTRYWVTDFLQVEPLADSYHQTDKYLSLCKNFITNEYASKFEVSKTDQADLLNRSIEYFKTKESFNLQEFTTEVIHHQDVVDTFMDYKKNFEAAKSFEIGDEFDIHLAAVKKQQRVFKSVLKLDKNFHIYIHGRRDLIEKGVDEMTGKKFYKIFYEEET